MHWPDVDWEVSEVYIHRSLEETGGRHRLKQTKTAAGRRRVRLAERTLMSLQEHQKRMKGEGHDVEEGLVFCDTQGGYLRQSNFLRNSSAPALARAGLAGKGILPYDMRHSSATLLLLAGVNIKVVSQRLGHESIEITLKHYAHCLPAMQQAAAEAWDKLLVDCPTIVSQEEVREEKEETQSKCS